MHQINKATYNNQFVMGPVVVAIQIAALVTALVITAQQIAKQVLQEQIKSKINQHRQELEALRDIKKYLQSLLSEKDIDTEGDIGKDIIFESMQKIQEFLQQSQNNLSLLIQNHPNSFLGHIIGNLDVAKKILPTFKKNTNLQSTRYLITKLINKKQTPSFAAGSLPIVSHLSGVDWKKLQFTLLVPGKLAAQIGKFIFTLKGIFDKGGFSSNAPSIGSILSAINLVMNIVSIIDNAVQLRKFIDQKNQITKQMELLPKTQVDSMNAIKESINCFLAYLIIGGDFIARIKQKIQFITIFTTDKELKKQFQDFLAKTPGPHQLITLQTIRKINNYASQLQELYVGGVNEANVKDKIFRTDDIFSRFFRQVNVNQIHEKMTKTFNQLKIYINKFNNQFEKVNKISIFLQFAIVTLEQGKKNDKFAGSELNQQYLNFFKKQQLDAGDKQTIVKCIAAVRQKFYADDPSGETYYGYKLLDYFSIFNRYSDFSKLTTFKQDITSYQQDWILQYQIPMIKSLKRFFKHQDNFQYYRSSLIYQKSYSQNRLQAKKSMYFKGAKDLYEAKCRLQDYPLFEVNTYQEEKFENVIVPSKNILARGKRLYNRQRLKSSNGAYYAIMQEDGNFVVYKGYQFVPEKAIWSSKTNRQISQYRLQMQMDGNLCIYDGKGIVIWATNTIGNNPNYHLSIQDNGVLGIYNEKNENVWKAYA